MEDFVMLGGGSAVSELEKVEGEYRSLQTEVIYSSFEGELDPLKQQRLEELAEQLMHLTDPDFSQAEPAIG